MQSPWNDTNECRLVIGVAENLLSFSLHTVNKLILVIKAPKTIDWSVYEKTIAFLNNNNNEMK